MKQIGVSERHNLKYDKTISRWDEALPLGNGHLGALVWGPADALRISLDRADIWDATPYPGIFEEEFSYQNMVKLAREGKEEEIRRIFDMPYNFVTPCKLPAGSLVISLPSEKTMQSELSLSTAEADIQTGMVHMNCFVHACKKIGVMQINSPAAEISWKIENPEYGISTGEEVDIEVSNSSAPSSIKKLRYPAPEKNCIGNTTYFIQRLSNGFSYGLFVAAKETEGRTLFTFGVAASHDGENWKENFIEELEEALETGYQKLFAQHCAWWKEFWEKSSVCLPDKLMEKNWYLTNYLLASCSRKGGYPMQLQGLWTADDGNLPPWKGDYHHDLNTQLCYYHYLKANHLEEGECFLDFLWNMRDVGKKFAKSFYHTEGMCIPAVMAIDGTALGGWGMYSLSPTNQIWLCQSFERYYSYTGDTEFLKEKAYPYLKDVAKCILGILEEKDGQYFLPMSSSPEIHDDTIKAFLTPNSNYDLALMRWLFEKLIMLAREIQKLEEMVSVEEDKTDRMNMDEEIAHWKQVLSKLPVLAVSEQGVLKISPDEMLTETHRHFSHLMAIHPLRLMDYQKEDNKRIIDTSIRNLEYLGSGAWCGYSYAWMAELYAVVGNGNGAASRLHAFWEAFCSPNGFHVNGDYKNMGFSGTHVRIFTLEGNMCAADALQEMLLQSENGVISLFPAIPEEWEKQEVSFRKLRAERGILVSAVCEKGKVISLEFEGDRTGCVKLRKSPYLKEFAEKNVWKEEDDFWLVER